MRFFLLTLILIAGLRPTCQAAKTRIFTMEVTVRDVAGNPILGAGGVRVELKQFPSGKQAASGGAVESGAAPGVYRATFREATGISADSAVLENQSWQVRVSASGYKERSFGPLRLKEQDGQIVPAEETARLETTLLRNGREWQAQFSCPLPEAPLPAAFVRLNNILDGKQDKCAPVPQDVYLQVLRAPLRSLFRKNPSINVGTLSKSGFYQLETEKHPEQAARARAAMLNIAHALNTEAEAGCMAPAQPDWLAEIQRVLVISEERMIARVKKELYLRVLEMANNAQVYTCQSTVTASVALHLFDDPVLWKTTGTRARARDTHSIKTPLCQGNVQITAAKFGDGENAVYLADFDIDENLAAGAHLLDVVRHAVTGRGTDAYEVYEMLVARGRHTEVEMGYRLAQQGKPVNQSCPEARRPLITADGTAAGPN